MVWFWFCLCKNVKKQAEKGLMAQTAFIDTNFSVQITRKDIIGPSNNMKLLQYSALWLIGSGR